jgi:hypothetical protein
LNLECFINYDARGSSLGGGKARLTFSSVECLRGVLGFVVLWVLRLRACWVSGFVGSLVVSFEFLAYLEPLVYPASVLRGASCFLINYITYQKSSLTMHKPYSLTINALATFHKDGRK